MENLVYKEEVIEIPQGTTQIIIRGYFTTIEVEPIEERDLDEDEEETEW